MADGCVDARGKAIALGLREGDWDALETAARVAGSDAPIRLQKPGVSPATGRATQRQAVWRIYSVQLVSRVKALGMVPGKSRRADICVPATVALSASFWRGVIDGDGTVCFSRSRERRSARVQVCAGPALLEQWAAFVVARIGEPSPRSRPVPGTKHLCVSTLADSRAWEMAKVLYGYRGAAMERKRKAALEILASPRPVPGKIAADLVEKALDSMGNLSLRDLPNRYVCPVSGVRLGDLVRRARQGRRADLHELFAKHDPDWRAPSRRGPERQVWVYGEA